MKSMATRQHEGARLDEHRVAGDMIEMMVRVDDKPDGQIRPAPDLRQQLLRAPCRRERIDHHHTVIANDETGVGRGGRIGPTDRSPHIPPTSVRVNGSSCAGAVLHMASARVQVMSIRLLNFTDLISPGPTLRT